MQTIMRTLFFLLLVALFCPALSFSQQTIQDTIMSGGMKRSYRIYIPAIYNAQKPSVPLLFVFHGQPTHPNSMLGAKINQVADTANFIIVYPYGQPASQPNTYYWDFYSANFMADVNFISNLIDTLLGQYNIDPNRIYSAGASGGGFMAYSLACNLSHRIAAVASVMGSMMTIN
jgi:polyhydroxybutyrate depolymerase